MPITMRPTQPRRQSRWPRVTRKDWPTDNDVIARVAEGKSNKVIGATLSLSEITDRNYVGNALDKLELSSRAELGGSTVAHHLLGRRPPISKRKHCPACADCARTGTCRPQDSALDSYARLDMMWSARCSLARKGKSKRLDARQSGRKPL